MAGLNCTNLKSYFSVFYSVIYGVKNGAQPMIKMLILVIVPANAVYLKTMTKAVSCQEFELQIELITWRTKIVNHSSTRSRCAEFCYSRILASDLQSIQFHLDCVLV